MKIGVVNVMGLVTYFMQPYLYKVLYILLKNLRSLRFNGYSFCAILYWFYFFTSGMVIYLSLGICIIPELIQSNKNLFTRVLKIFMYGVKKMRIPLGNLISFWILGFNKITPGIIFRRFGRYEGNSLRDNILINILIRSVLSEVGFDVLEIILFSEVVSIYFVTGDKVNSFLIIKIAK